MQQQQASYVTVSTATASEGGDEGGGADPQVKNIRQLVRGHLEEDAGLDPREAEDAEIGIFNWALEAAETKSIAKSWKQATFVALYARKAKAVVVNMDGGSFLGNTGLVERMRAGEFRPHDVAFMQPFDVFPERWKQVIEAKTQREEFVYNDKPTSMTDQFLCGKCKQRECVYRELQLRSCDEPASVFVSCLKCGNNWRVG
jgi:DNA-directed RNA polymerase subunit M/transcription elongation factor TFIIS